MSVKVFLPAELFYIKIDCELYGEIQINDNSAISYFVIANSDAYKRLRHLGHISSVGSAAELRDVSLSFSYDSVTPNIYLNQLSIKPSSDTTHINVFLYDGHKVLQLHTLDLPQKQNSGNGESKPEHCDDIDMLFHLLHDCQMSRNYPQHKNAVKMFIYTALNLPFDLMTGLFTLLIECQPCVLLLRNTVLYDHYLQWKELRTTGKRKANIALDKLLGICVMLILLFYISHPGDYLIQTSHFIIRKLRLLLSALKGSPIGLKLNVHLNNFFLDCFNYHIDLWATFLDLIEPFVRQLFVPIALLGSMGLSYQLALLADLISVIGLHAHCFYIYAAILYKVEIKGIQVLWKVVLGKRHNLLKNRVESHNYMNRQLYLATIFFTSLLFLFPTIVVYYIVFTTLRLCIYLVNIVLLCKRRSMLEFPLALLTKWLMSRFFEKESIQLQYMPHVPSPLLKQNTAIMHMSVFEINVQSSSLGRVFSGESVLYETLKFCLNWKICGLFL